MKIWIDLFVLAIIALSTALGYKKGLIKVAFGLISFLLAIILSVILYKPVSRFIIEYTPLDDYIEHMVTERLCAPGATPEEIENILSNYYNNFKNSSTIVLADGISKTIINIACIGIVFIVSRLILILFQWLGDVFAKIPLIKQINHAAGFLYGLLRGFVIIYGILAIIAISIPIININNIVTIINSTIITNIMYNHNIILILFG